MDRFALLQVGGLLSGAVDWAISPVCTSSPTARPETLNLSGFIYVDRTNPDDGSILSRDVSAPMIDWEEVVCALGSVLGVC